MRFWLTAAGILLLDRFSKIWIMNNVNVGSAWIVINGILNISYIHNRGAAFACFSTDIFHISPVWSCDRKMRVQPNASNDLRAL